MPVWLHVAFGSCLVIAAALFLSMEMHRVERPLSGPASLRWPEIRVGESSAREEQPSIEVTAVFPRRWASKIGVGMPLTIHLESDPSTAWETHISRVAPFSMSALGADQPATHEFVRVSASIHADAFEPGLMREGQPLQLVANATVQVESASLLQLLLRRLTPQTNRGRA